MWAFLLGTNQSREVRGNMKKICFITQCTLPIPTVKGGAVETLVEYILDENEKNPQYDFTVISAADNDAQKKSLNYKYVDFKYIENKNKQVNVVLNNLQRLAQHIGVYTPYSLAFMKLNKILKELPEQDLYIYEAGPTTQIPLLGRVIPKNKFLVHIHWDGMGNRTKDKYFLKLLPVSNYIGCQWKKATGCDDEKIINFLYSKIIRKESYVESIIKNAINDSYKRLIKPAIEREIRSDLTDKASSDAIDSFGLNLEKLLLTPPLKEKWVMGLDPAFRTGCKLAVIDPTGKMVEIAKIYPHEPVKKYEEAKMQVKALLDKYKIEIIAIGNGTASRESEAFIADTIKDYKNVNYIIVSEAGASVYSASPLAKSEFPDLQVEERSAVSIGRRLQDPLAELVKINPESIGVGLYQHDLPNKKLSETLDFTVSKAVNMVGVNINTASPYLLKYISGLNKSSIEKIIKYRENKRFESREELLDKKILSPKVYEQAIGFLRVNGSNILDETSIHPESYPLALKLLEELNLNINDIGTDKMNININIDEMSKKLNTDTFTLEDIILSLKKPKRDPRDEAKKPILRHDILDIKDLKIGDTLNGTVRNVTPFGAFVDIGLHDDGLIHISKMSKDFVKDPGDILSVGEIIEVYVDSIDLAKKRIGLSLIK